MQPTIIFDGEDSFVSHPAAIGRKRNIEEWENFYAPVYGPGNPLQIIKYPSIQQISSPKLQPIPQESASLPSGTTSQTGGIVPGATYGAEVPGTYSGTSGGLKTLPSPSSLGPATTNGGSAISSNPNPVPGSNTSSQPPATAQPTASAASNAPIGGISTPFGSSLAGGGAGGGGSATSSGTAAAPQKTLLQKYWWVLAAAGVLGIGIYIVKRK